MFLPLLLTLALTPAPLRPNHVLTRGLTRDLSLKTVCETRWGVDRRKVTLSMKRRVFAAYGLPWASHALYEVDHLIPRSLAGADDTVNLWPQAWAGPYGAHQKDHLEIILGKLVCNGSMTLEFAQEAIRVDWIAAYRLYVEGPKP